MLLHLEEDLSEEVKKNNSADLKDFQVLNNRIRNEHNQSKHIEIQSQDIVLCKA